MPKTKLLGVNRIKVGFSNNKLDKVLLLIPFGVIQRIEWLCLTLL